MRNTTAGIAVLAMMAILGTASRADAALMAYICDDMLCTGGGDTIITDQGVGDHFPGSTQVGQINSGALNVNGVTIITNISQSRPLLGDVSAPQLDLTFQATTTDDLSHTVWLYASDTGFTGSGSLLLTIGGTQTSVGNTLFAGAFGGTSNNNLDRANMLALLGPITETPFARSMGGTLFPLFNPYSLTIGVQITRAGAGTTTGDLNLNVPEPASMALFGLGLLGFASITQRRRRALVS